MAQPTTPLGGLQPAAGELAPGFSGPIPATDAVQVGSAAQGPADEQGPSPQQSPKEFRALRKVVEFREMDVGELVATCGLSAGLRAMSAAEINPIVTHGKACVIASRCRHLLLALRHSCC
jgi:hypothetical protein